MQQPLPQPPARLEDTGATAHPVSTHSCFLGWELGHLEGTRFCQRRHANELARPSSFLPPPPSTQGGPQEKEPSRSTAETRPQAGGKRGAWPAARGVAYGAAVVSGRGPNVSSSLSLGSSGGGWDSARAARFTLPRARGGRGRRAGGGARRGPRAPGGGAAGARGRGRGAGTRLLLGGGVAGPGAAARQAPPPARGDLRGGGGGERAVLRRRLAGGLPPLGPPRPGRSGSDSASGGLGVGEPAAALGGPGGAQAESLGKGGGWAASGSAQGPCAAEPRGCREPPVSCCEPCVFFPAPPSL